jgi:hypothetical protein
LDTAHASGGSLELQRQLLELREDPRIRRFALKLADGHPDLAEDLLQAASVGVIALRHPMRIENPHAYFLRVLANEAHKLYSSRRETPRENPEDANQPGAAACGPAQTRPVDDTACISVQGQIWLERLAAGHVSLLAAIPCRSDDPGRYRAVIYAAAGQILLDGLNGEPSDADSKTVLSAAYPAYFTQPDARANTIHQRSRRAREDVKVLLRSIIRREELS